MTKHGVRLANLSDLEYIESLSRKEAKSIGFIPNIAYKSAIVGERVSVNRWSKTCNDKLFVCEENGDLVGFALFSYGKRPKVNQICIQADARMIERGKGLLSCGINHGVSSVFRKTFICGCADDLESNKFWNAVGWVKIGERKGISHTNTWKETSDRKVNIYSYNVDGKYLIQKPLFNLQEIFIK